MEARRKERIEDGRVSNGLVFILKGLAWFAAAMVVFLILHYIDQQGLEEIRSGGGGRRTRGLRGVILLLYYLKGKFWVPPILAMIGAWYSYLGFGSLTRRVDIDDQDDLPDY